VVRSEAKLFKALNELEAIQGLLGQALKKATGLEAKFHPIGFGLCPDTSLIAELKPIPFRVERKAGVGFEMNHYYSAAPLPTDMHLQMLERLENLS
jgi:hypothetical protein